MKEISETSNTSSLEGEETRQHINAEVTGFILKPLVTEIAKNQISSLTEFENLCKNLEKEIEEKAETLERATFNMIITIAAIIDAKDKNTSGHSKRVAHYATDIAKQLGWNEVECQNLYIVALLHDIGKIGIPDTILNKPSRLTDEEFATIKRHPIIGDAILKELYMFEKVEEGALYHHERYDGKGYPVGLKGEEIPIYARIIGIADSYDAMSSNRVYRSKLPREKIISEFENGLGTQFDPKIGALFVTMLKNGYDVDVDNTEA